MAPQPHYMRVATAMKRVPDTTVLWPTNERFLDYSWFVGAAYGGWIGHLLEAGWATLALLPICAVFGAATWIATAMVLVKIGEFIQRRASVWLAVTVQALALPIVLTIAAFLIGGSGPEGPGRYGSP